MKFGGDITMQGPAPGSPITILDSWDPNPAGASEGDLYSMSGSIYCYDSTYGCLVRPVVYKQANKYLDIYITGSETTTEAVVAAGFGSATAVDNYSTSTWVGPNNNSYWILTISGSPMMYYAGYLKSEGGPSADWASIGVISLSTATSGHYALSARMLDSTDPDKDPGFVRYSGGGSGMNINTTPFNSNFDLTISDPPWVEIYLCEDAPSSGLNFGAMAWIGHSKIPVKISSIPTAQWVGTARWLVGDGTGGTAAIALKNSWFMRATS